MPYLVVIRAGVYQSDQVELAWDRVAQIRGRTNYNDGFISLVIIPFFSFIRQRLGPDTISSVKRHDNNRSQVCSDVVARSFAPRRNGNGFNLIKKDKTWRHFPRSMKQIGDGTF